MSRIPIGVDIVEIQDIEQAIQSHHDSFLKRVFTDAELKSCHSNIASLAARFAAKEAVMKALRTGAKGISWKDIEVSTDAQGAPYIQLHGRADEKSKEIGIIEFSVTLSHSENYAIAFVIGDALTPY